MFSAFTHIEKSEFDVLKTKRNFKIENFNVLNIFKHKKWKKQYAYILILEIKFYKNGTEQKFLFKKSFTNGFDGDILKMKQS